MTNVVIQDAAALAAATGPALRGRDPGPALARLDAARETLEAALAETLARNCPAEGVAIAAEIWPWWLSRGRLADGAAWLKRLLDAPGAQAPTADRARALAGAGNLAFHRGDADASERVLRECLTIGEALGAAQIVAEARGGLSRVAMSRNDAAGMREHSAVALEAARASGYETGEAIALHHLAHAAVMDGDLPEAERRYAANIAVYRGMGRRELVVSELHNLGHVACLRGDIARARALFVESLETAGNSGDAITPYNIIGLGRVAAALGRPAEALTLLAAGTAILRGQGKAVVPLLRPAVEAALTGTRATLDAETRAAADAAGEALGIEEAIAAAIAVRV